MPVVTSLYVRGCKIGPLVGNNVVQDIIHIFPAFFKSSDGGSGRSSTGKEGKPRSTIGTHSDKKESLSPSRLKEVHSNQFSIR